MPKCDFDKVARNFIEIALRHGCSPVNLLHIFRTPFPKNTTGAFTFTQYCRSRQHREMLWRETMPKTSKGIYMFCLRLHLFFRTPADDQF